MPDDARGRYMYALETLELANANWRNVGRPWRFWKWLRNDRLIRARNDALIKSRGFS